MTLAYIVPHSLSHLITAQKWGCGKVMFSVMSVYSKRVFMWPVPMMHLGPALQPPLYNFLTQTPSSVTSGDREWRPVETCSFEDLTVQALCLSIWWLVTEACMVSEWVVACYWNAFSLPLEDVWVANGNTSRYLSRFNNGNVLSVTTVGNIFADT